jgi:hypothetical protein
MPRLRTLIAKRGAAIFLSSLLLIAGTSDGNAAHAYPDTCQYTIEEPNSPCGICYDTSDCGTYYGSPLCCWIL